MTTATATEIKIDKGISVPPHGNDGKAKYPLATMEVGDSFFAPVKQTSITGSFIWVRLKDPSKKFTTRTVTENGVKGVRVWRIE